MHDLDTFFTESLYAAHQWSTEAHARIEEDHTVGDLEEALDHADAEAEAEAYARAEATLEITHYLSGTVAHIAEDLEL